MGCLLALTAALTLVPVGANAGGAGAEPKIRPVAETISTGTAHTCVVVRDVVRCAGEDEQGELGNGTYAALQANPTPNNVIGRSSQVAAGGLHTCALGDHGNVSCWGWNAYGQLGDGQEGCNPDDSYDCRSTTPVGVESLPPASSVVAGSDHTCALTESGGVWCWGNNADGELGNGQAGCDPGQLQSCRSATPVPVSDLSSGVKQISAGNGYSCAVTRAGAVLCWGGASTRPVPVPGLGRDVVAVSVGGHACALTTAGAVMCWGDNEWGELGDGTRTNRSTPVTAIGRGAAAVAAGYDHTCVISTKGGVACWGRNQWGELGDGTEQLRTRPTPVKGLGLGSGATEIAAGYQFTCVRLGGDIIRCWGKNQFGPLGDGTTETRTTPAPTKFGFPTVTFIIREHGDQSQIIGAGELEIVAVPTKPGERVSIIGGFGAIHFHEWRLVGRNAMLTLDSWTLDVRPSGRFYMTAGGAVIDQLKVVVRDPDPHEQNRCAARQEGIVALGDNAPNGRDEIFIHTCHVKQHFVKDAHTRLAVAIDLER